MKQHLSDRINRLSESQTIAMARKSRELIAQGVDIISLSLGEPDFHTPDVIKKAAHEAIDADFSYYTHVSGYLELRQAIAEKFRRDNKLTYAPDQIVVSTGAKQSIANAVLSLVNPGDEVIVPAPFWVSYLEIIKLAEGKPVVIDTGIESDFKVTAAQIEAAITPKTATRTAAASFHAWRGETDGTPRDRIRPSMVNAPLRTAGFSRIASRSLADWGRASGSFSRQRWTASSSAPGMPGLSFRGGSGDSVRCARSTAATVSRGKTGRPQSASYASAPNAYRSVRASSLVSPATCSGAM